MAVRRTLKQKQRAQIHRQEEAVYSYASSEKPDKKTAEASSEAKPISQAEPSVSLKLFGYNPQVVYNDLLKTLIVTVIVVAVLLVIFFMTR